MRRVVIAGIAFIVWLLLTWPFGNPDWYQPVFLGLIASIFVASIFGELLPETPLHMFEPQRYFWGLCYIFVFLYYCVLANIDVAYRILHPEMPVKPGVIKVKTRLKNRSALAVLANSITLTPGTTTIDLTSDGYLYVHWIYVKTMDVEEASAMLVNHYEKILTRIFE